LDASLILLYGEEKYVPNHHGFIWTLTILVYCLMCGQSLLPHHYAFFDREIKEVKNYIFELDTHIILFNSKNKHVNLVKLKMKTKIDLSSIAQELKQVNAELGTKKTEP